MHEKRAYIFIGQSGSGKGTQVELLEATLRKLDQYTMFFHVTTGDRFRELLTHETYTVERTREHMLLGKLPPSFLGIHAWAHTLIYQYNAEDVVFIDGTPRICEEVPVLLGALEFLHIEPVVIMIKVSDVWAHEKAKGRGRADDTDEEELRGRLQWFHDRVTPVIEMLKTDDRVRYIEINGEQTIPEVHEEILSALKIS